MCFFLCVFADKKSNPEPEDTTPMDTLRKQLRNLDELEEQFPATVLADTYLPYPFPGDGKYLNQQIGQEARISNGMVSKRSRLLNSSLDIYFAFFGS